jgi:hypothetical protein
VSHLPQRPRGGGPRVPQAGTEEVEEARHGGLADRDHRLHREVAQVPRFPFEDLAQDLDRSLRALAAESLDQDLLVAKVAAADRF